MHDYRARHIEANALEDAQREQVRRNIDAFFRVFRVRVARLSVVTTTTTTVVTTTTNASESSMLETAAFSSSTQPALASEPRGPLP